MKRSRRSEVEAAVSQNGSFPMPIFELRGEYYTVVPLNCLQGDDIGPAECDVCGTQFVRVMDLASHMKSIHSQPLRFEERLIQHLHPSFLGNEVVVLQNMSTLTETIGRLVRIPYLAHTLRIPTATRVPHRILRIAGPEEIERANAWSVALRGLSDQGPLQPSDPIDALVDCFITHGRSVNLAPGVTVHFSAAVSTRLAAATDLDWEGPLLLLRGKLSEPGLNLDNMWAPTRHIQVAQQERALADGRQVITFANESAMLVFNAAASLTISKPVRDRVAALVEDFLLRLF